MSAIPSSSRYFIPLPQDRQGNTGWQPFVIKGVSEWKIYDREDNIYRGARSIEEIYRSFSAASFKVVQNEIVPDDPSMFLRCYPNIDFKIDEDIIVVGPEEFRKLYKRVPFKLFVDDPFTEWTVPRAFFAECSGPERKLSFEEYWESVHPFYLRYIGADQPESERDKRSRSLSWSTWSLSSQQEDHTGFIPISATGEEPI